MMIRSIHFQPLQCGEVKNKSVMLLHQNGNNAWYLNTGWNNNNKNNQYLAVPFYEYRF